MNVSIPTTVSPHPTHQEMVVAAKTIDRLNKTARHYKIASKISACCFLPFSLLNFGFSYVCNCCSCSPFYFSLVNNDGIPYSHFTRCDGGTCWHPRIWPETNGDRLDAALCDPCVCCFCCTKETHNDFLTYPERQQMNAAIRVLNQLPSIPEEGNATAEGEILKNVKIPPLSADRQTIVIKYKI